MILSAPSRSKNIRASSSCFEDEKMVAMPTAPMRSSSKNSISGTMLPIDEDHEMDVSVIDLSTNFALSPLTRAKIKSKRLKNRALNADDFALLMPRILKKKTECSQNLAFFAARPERGEGA